MRAPAEAEQAGNAYRQVLTRATEPDMRFWLEQAEMETKTWLDGCGLPAIQYRMASREFGCKCEGNRV
jgi:hypothetical protein